MAARTVTASPQFALSASVSIAVASAVVVRAAPSFALIASVPALIGTSASFRAAPLFELNTRANLTGASDRRGMSVCDVLDQVLALWGVFCRKSAPDFAISRAIADINTALQLVWNNAEGRTYWSQVPITVSFADGVSSVQLADDIQNVIGPCRRSDNRRPLSPIGTMGEFETFRELYLDGETSDEPLAYYIERDNQSGSEPARTTLFITPAPSGESVDILLDVVKEAPRFSAGDLVACPAIPIPHHYVESLLLPIARYQASSFYLFRQKDQKEAIDREYLQARMSLGLADPLPGKAGDNLNKREEVKK